MQAQTTKEKTVRLRAIEPEDLDLLYKIENDRSVWNVGTTNVPYSKYTLHQFVADNTADIYTDKQVRMMVDNMAGETVGIVDIIDFNPTHRRAEMGIVICRNQRKQGYAYAATKQILTYCHDILHLNQLYAIVSHDNISAGKLFRKTGFQANTILKQWLYDGDNYIDCTLFQYFF